jgi:predicted permease
VKSALVNAGYHTRLVSLEADVVRNIRAPLQLLWGGVLFVLLIAAVNITNLSLVRASGRLKELAMRHALGAARTRVTRQLVTETTLLTIAGGALGLLLGLWSLGSLNALGLADMPRAHEIRIDAVVVAWTAALALALGIVVGAVPAMQSAGVSLATMLREEGRSGTAGRWTRRMRRVLVSAQVALAFVLLIGAALLLVSFNNLLAVDPGFTPEHVLTGRVTLLRTKYRDDAALRSYAVRALEGIRGLPGVVAAGATSYLPFSTDASSSVIIPEGHATTPGESVVSPNQLYVTPGYLEAMRVPVKRGRLFAESDTHEAPRVVIIDEQLAKRFWPNADPIGRRLYLPQRAEDVEKPGPGVIWLQVVGVVAAVKMRGVVEAEGARVGAYYMPMAQDPVRGLAFAVRTTGHPTDATASVRRVLTSLDPEAQMFDVITMSDRVQRSLNPRRAPMLLSLAFGLVALLLASLGLYGVLAYQVSQRTREIGIRMALGNDAAGILRLVLREGGVLVAMGLLAGLVGALGLGRVISSQLYGIGALDPAVIMIVVAVLGVVSLAACLGPALRASRVNPVIALMHQ